MFEQSANTQLIDWASIETVLLDMDGTLLDLHFDNFFWRTILPKANLKHKNIDLQKLFKDNFGTLNWYCIDYWEQKLNLDIMALKQEHTHLIKFRADAKQFLDFLVQQGIKPVLITNAHPKTLGLKLKFCALDQWIHTMFTSHEFKKPKEDILFWHRFHDHFTFNPNTTLLIDDNEAVLKTAQQFGIRDLFSIQKPDSQQNESNSSEFPLIDQFRTLYSIGP